MRYDPDTGTRLSMLQGAVDDLFQEVTATIASPALGPTPWPALIHFGPLARIDAARDFLDSYEGPRNGDLDVLLADAVLSQPDEVVLRGVHAAPIGTTEGAAYVWGIDRGAGTDLLASLDPPAGEGVTFDAVAIILPDGTGTVIDLVGGGVPQAIDPSNISIAGSTISVSLSSSLLPSQGLEFEDFRYNLWPRYAPDGVDPGDNTQISDFAPDASTFTARQHAPFGDWLGHEAVEDAFGVVADLIGWASRGGSLAAGSDVM